MKIKSLIAILFFGVLYLNSCYYDNVEELYPPACDTCGVNCETTGITYSLIVEPIISAQCGACHYGASPSGGSRFDTFDSFKAIVNSSSANLLCRIKWEAGCNPMPQGGSKMSSCDILKIETWISSGTPN